MSRDTIARVLGHALVDQKFAESLHADPTTAAQSIGVHLNSDQAAALKGIDIHQINTVGSAIRNKVGAQAFYDQNQNQQQALME
jgi:hypothetical protein